MYGWTKWGGRTGGIFIDQSVEDWTCQSCGSRQTNHLPSYMYPFDEERREYMRVCSLCKHMAIIRKIAIFTSLMHEVRGGIDDLANPMEF